MTYMRMPKSPEHRQFYSGGYRLTGTLYRPVTAPRAAVVLNPATAVPQSYYAEFASWLAETQGLTCLTFDYRDFGASMRGHPRDSAATMADWGIHDQQAARDHLCVAFPDLPLWVIGHSLGGLLLPFQTDLDQIDRVITVASGPVHQSDHPYPYKLTAMAFWHLVGPPAVVLRGYMPGRKLGFGDDIPSGVFWQWRKWCTSRGFFAADIGHRLPMPDWQGIKAQMRFVAIKDDPMVPPAAVWRLMAFYPAAQKRQMVLDPQAFGLTSIGHIAPFAPRNRAVWEAIIAND